MDTIIIDDNLLFLTEEVYKDYFESLGYIAACYSICIKSISNDYKNGNYTSAFYFNQHKLVWYIYSSHIKHYNELQENNIRYINIRDFKFHIMKKLIE